MTRTEFCTQLQQLKSESKLKTIEICTLTQFMPHQSARIIKGASNFSMNKCFTLLEALKGELIISNDKTQIGCKTYSELSDFLIELRASKQLNPYKFGQLANVDPTSVQQYEKGNTSVSVDTFLKIMDAMGYTVEVRCIEDS